MNSVIKAWFVTKAEDYPGATLLQAVEQPDVTTVVALASEAVEGTVKEADLTAFGALCYYGAPGEKPWVRWTDAAKAAAGVEDEPSA